MWASGLGDGKYKGPLFCEYQVKCSRDTCHDVYDYRRMISQRQVLGAYSGSELSPRLFVLSKLVSLQVNSQSSTMAKRQ